MRESKSNTSHNDENVIKHIGKNVDLGYNTKIWHFTYIGDNTKIGDDTKVGSLSHIDYDVKIGDRCRIEGMVYIPPLTVVGNDVFIGPGVIITNDPYPPSKRLIGVTIQDEAIICAGAILKAGITIGKNSVIGMGSVVTKNVPPESVVFGNPSRIQYGFDKYLDKKKTWERRED